MSSLLIGLNFFSNFPIIMTSWLLAIESCHLTFTILRPYHPCRCSWAKLCGHHSYHHHYHHPYLTSLQPPWNSMSCWCLCHQQFLKSFDERCVLWALPWNIFWWVFLSPIFIIPACLQPSASLLVSLPYSRETQTFTLFWVIYITFSVFWSATPAELGTPLVSLLGC